MISSPAHSGAQVHRSGRWVTRPPVASGSLLSPTSPRRYSPSESMAALAGMPIMVLPEIRRGAAKTSPCGVTRQVPKSAVCLTKVLKLVRRMFSAISSTTAVRRCDRISSSIGELRRPS